VKRLFLVSFFILITLGFCLADSSTLNTTGLILGLSGSNLEVLGVFPGSYAEKAGINKGDVIAEFNDGTGFKAITPELLSKAAVLAVSPPSSVKIKIKRVEEVREITLFSTPFTFSFDNMPDCGIPNGSVKSMDYSSAKASFPEGAVIEPGDMFIIFREKKYYGKGKISLTDGLSAKLSVTLSSCPDPVKEPEKFSLVFYQHSPSFFNKIMLAGSPQPPQNTVKQPAFATAATPNPEKTFSVIGKPAKPTNFEEEVENEHNCRVSKVNPDVQKFEDAMKAGQYKVVYSAKVTDLNFGRSAFTASWIQGQSSPAGVGAQWVYWSAEDLIKLPILYGSYTKFYTRKFIPDEKRKAAAEQKYIRQGKPIPPDLNPGYMTDVPSCASEVLKNGNKVTIFYKKEGEIYRAYLIKTPNY